MTINIRDVDEDGTVTFSPEMPGVGNTITATLTDDDVPLIDVTWSWTQIAGTNPGNSPSYTAVD